MMINPIEIKIERGEIVSEIDAERKKQDAKWGEQNHPDGTGGINRINVAEIAKMRCEVATERGGVTWRHILDEEVKEAFAEADPEKLKTELVQVAAVCVAWVEAIDRRYR